MSEVSTGPPTVTVPFTLGGTATGGTDYSGVTTSPLVFASGQTTAAITGTLSAGHSAHPDAYVHFGHAHERQPRQPRCQHPDHQRAGPASVQFGAGSETVNASAGTFSIPVTITGTPGGTPVVTTFATGFNGPVNLAFDSSGNLYVSNSGGNTVSEVTPAGVVSTFASGFNSPYGLAFDTRR